MFPEILIASAALIALVVGFFLYRGMKPTASGTTPQKSSSRPRRAHAACQDPTPESRKSSKPPQAKTDTDPSRPDAQAQDKPLAPLVEPPEESEVSGPIKLILVTAVGMTDPGLKRKHNEDAYVLMSKHNLFAIADGMGMHAAGEVASKLTIESMSDSFEKGLFVDNQAERNSKLSYRNRLTHVIQHANEIVFSMASEVEAYQGMGTTVVAAHFSQSKQRAYIAHVGDSRCYRLRGDEIRQLTVDHTLGNIGLGITGKTSGILSRAVGIEETVEVDITIDEPQIGDIYLLCSDGLSRMTTDDKILETVKASKDLDDAVHKLIALANEGGGRDNVTTILIRVDPAMPQ